MPQIRVKPAIEMVYIRDSPVGSTAHTRLDCPLLNEGVKGETVDLWACELLERTPEGIVIRTPGGEKSLRKECRHCEHAPGEPTYPVEYLQASSFDLR